MLILPNKNYTKVKPTNLFSLNIVRIYCTSHVPILLCRINGETLLHLPPLTTHLCSFCQMFNVWDIVFLFLTEP